MKIFLLIIAITIICISIFNIISQIIGYHHLTPYTYGIIVGNLILLITSSICLYIIQKKKI